MSDDGTVGIFDWIAGVAGAAIIGVSGWVLRLGNRMTVAEAVIEAEKTKTLGLATTISERSAVLFQTRDDARDNAKDIAVMRGDVNRNGAAIVKLERVHQEVMDGIKDILRRLPEK